MDTSANLPDIIPSEPPGKDWSRVHLHIVIDAQTPDIPETVQSILNEEALELWFYSNHEKPDITFVSSTIGSTKVPYSEIHAVANPVLGGLLTMFAKCSQYLTKTKNTHFLSLR